MVNEPRIFSVDGPLSEQSLENEKLRLIRVLVDALTPTSRAQLARELSKYAENLSPTGVLAEVIRLFPLGNEVTAAELRQKLAEQGVNAAPKEVYNSISYLSKIGALRRLGYGRYTVHGMQISTSDDLGGERDRHEDLSDD